MDTVQGMILAAGRGTRLLPLTHLRAKPAVPFLNRPLIQYSVDLLSQAGVEDIIVNLHHLPGSVREAVGGSAGRIRFSHEEEILGTAGAVGNIRQWLKGDTLLLCNGKIYLETDMRRFVREHRAGGAWVSMLLRPWHKGDPFSPVLVDRDGNVRRFGLPRPGDEPWRAGIFTGLQAWRTDVVNEIPPGRSESVQCLFPKLMSDGKAVKGVFQDSYWAECSSPSRYLDESCRLLRRRMQASPSEGPGRGDQWETVLGRDVVLGEGCGLRQSVLWDEVVLGSGVQLNRAILAEGVSLEGGTRLRDAIVIGRDRIQAEETAGAKRLGSNWVWPLH